jgi:hypothetical protein
VYPKLRATHILNYELVSPTLDARATGRNDIDISKTPLGLLESNPVARESNRSLLTDLPPSALSNFRRLSRMRYVNGHAVSN